MLRDYQQEMLQRLRGAWERCRSVMVQMPTGTGKTHVMAAAIRGYAGQEVLVVAHRIELIEQISQTLDAFGIGHGCIVGGTVTDERQEVQVASIQTLTKRLEKMPICPALIVIDEAHHALAKTYRALCERWPQARVLGLTATPCRLNGAPFTDLFQQLLQSATIQAFIDRGWLSDFEYVSASPDSEAMRMIASLQKRGADGDYQTKEMATEMDVPESIEHLYDSYRQFANGKKGIVYAIDRQHAQHIADYYQEHGVSCCAIDCKTPADERKRLTADYMEGRLQVIVNVDLYSEGYDMPDMEFIQLARPTLSLSKYLQQVGRGMRISEGKDHVLILDMVGLYQTFGLPTDERDWRTFFYGRAKGRGLSMSTAPIIIRDEEDADERMLINLEMVRIRRRSEKLEGLAVYLQDGKFGVVKDGKPTTPAVFERVDRCKNGEPFYAYGIYPYKIYQNRKTVIDRKGADQGVQLYGDVELRGEFLFGQDMQGDILIWDTIGKRTYREQTPTFEKIGGLDLIKVGNDEYELRNSGGVHLMRFKKSEIVFNDYIAIIRDKLFLKGDNNRAFNIFAYKDDYVMAYGKNRRSYIPIFWDGKVGKLQGNYLKDIKTYPDVDQMHLKVVGGKPHYAFTGVSYKLLPL